MHTEQSIVDAHAALTEELRKHHLVLKSEKGKWHISQGTGLNSTPCKPLQSFETLAEVKIFFDGFRIGKV